MGLKIWLFAVFGNEAELMPYFLRHYAPWVNRLILFDNCSTDGTADLIRACPQASVKPYVTIDRTVQDSVVMAEFLAQAYREARGQADYAIVVDCDEFLWSRSAPLRDVLHRCRAQGVQAIKSCGYQMITDFFPDGEQPITELVRCGVRDAEYDKMSVFDPALDVAWVPGRHNYQIGSGQRATALDVRLLHYRYLGESYFRRRNAYNFANRSADEAAKNRGYNTAPDYLSGKYSAAWYQHAQSSVQDVIADF
jgi:hypothetical protein